MIVAAAAKDFEAQVNLYHAIFLYAAIAAGVFLAAAIALFFLLKIPRVFGEMTGRDARRAIQEMSAGDGTSRSLGASAKIGSDGRRHRRENRTGPLGTSRLKRSAKSGSLKSKETVPPGYETPAGLSGGQTPQGALGTRPGAQTAYAAAQAQVGNQPAYAAPGRPQPAAYGGEGASETSVLDDGASETSVLNSGVDETSVLGGTPVGQEPVWEEPAETADLESYAKPFGQGAAAQAADGGGSGMRDAEPYSETMVLGLELRDGGRNRNFYIIRSIVEIHTNEILS